MIRRYRNPFLKRHPQKDVITNPELSIPVDMEPEFIKMYQRCKNYTMTSIERMYSLYKAVEYVVKFDIPGDIVECGVWRGGSSMLCALALMKMKEKNKSIYLYDTYEGMSRPTKKDITFEGESAMSKWKCLKNGEVNKWAYSSIEEVKSNMYSTHFNRNRLTFVQGKVEDTIPVEMPLQISILRLDTDWYESTYHELVHLFPRLSVKGVLIIDDYGHWKGAREATDNYFRENRIMMYLHRIDYTGRIGIKVNP